MKIAAYKDGKNVLETNKKLYDQYLIYFLPTFSE